MTDEQSDVVVVGGGLAGSTSALRAAELGLSVTLVERGGDERYMCNTRQSGGVFHIAMHDIRTGAEHLAEVMRNATDGHADPAQTGLVSRGAARLVAWLQQQGAQFIRGPAAWQNFILAPPRPIAAGVDWSGRGPDVLLRRMAERIVGRGGRRLLGTAAVELAMTGSGCTGVVVESHGVRRRINARAVVLADGGFQANLVMLRRHITAQPEKLKQRGGATGFGDGIRMGESAGAALTDMSRFYGHLLSRDAMTSDRVWPYPELDALATAGLVVDTESRRVADEGIGGVHLANQLARTSDPLGLTAIFDQAIWIGAGRSARIPANPTLEKAGACIHRAATLGELASKAGLPATALEATVAAYNAALSRGDLAALSPLRSSNIVPQPVQVPPFHAIPLAIGITYTMGGLVIDGDARVLSTSGEPITGLYAAGATTGGLEGGPRSTYLGGLVKAGTHGLAAAEHIAATLGGNR